MDENIAAIALDSIGLKHCCTGTALANKNARIIWSLLKTGENFSYNQAQAAT